MIEWEVTDAGLRALDNANVEVAIEAEDWQADTPTVEIPRPTDEVVQGRASELRFPEAFVFVNDLDSPATHEIGTSADPIELEPSDYLVNLGTGIKTYIRFDAAATISKTADFDGVVLSFPDRIPVTLGFRSRHEYPVGTITIPPTPEGFATGLSHLHSSIKTTSPDRSFPTLRGHPPQLELGEELDVPEPVAEARTDTGIEVVAPPAIEELLVLAPLVYYLQAEVVLEPIERPVLRAPAEGFAHEFTALPDLQHDVAATLRRLFFLDCLVRTVGPHGTNLAEGAVLDDLPMDPDWAYEADPQSRLAIYFDQPDAVVAGKLPDWHLSTYIEPSVDHLSAVPFVLNKMSLVWLPETRRVSSGEIIDSSLDDFYRAGNVDRDGALHRDGKLYRDENLYRGGDLYGDGGRYLDGGRYREGGRSGDEAGERPTLSAGQTGDPRSQSDPTGPARGSSARQVASVDVVKPVLREGRTHAWLADGIPIDVFKTTNSAFENRLEYLERESEEINVQVVLNDEEMEEEHREVAKIYRERAEELPIGVSVAEYLTTDELAAVFEADNDFVHYIGHCEKSGLRCSDGNLSIADIEESNTQTFFLNACGSYYEGMDLVEKGSVAGAVTLSKVLNKQAAKVGTTFARLLSTGYSLERSIGLARRRIMTSKDYAVVGDGTHSLTQCDTLFPVVLTGEQIGEDTFRVEAEMLPSHIYGGVYVWYTDATDKTHLCGSKTTYVVDREKLRSSLERAMEPIIFDGTFYWPEELQAELAED